MHDQKPLTHYKDANPTLSFQPFARLIIFFPPVLYFKTEVYFS